MQTLEVEKFIQAVRKRPALWDANTKQYKDRDHRYESWMEVCQVMDPDFANKTAEERQKMGHDLQLKWKNLRDAYVRHLRMQLGTGSNKRWRGYIYRREMSFLRGVVNPRSRGGSCTPFYIPRKKVKTEEDNEQDQLEVEDGEELELSQEDFAEMEEYDASAVNKVEEEEELDIIDPLISRTDRDGPDCDDMNFFKSLLPTLKTLKMQQKLKFRIDVMELLMTYHQPA